FVSLKSVVERLKSGFSVFASMILVNIFASYQFIVLKNNSSEVDVGIYATAFKLAITIQTIIIMPFSQALFPHLAFKAQENLRDFKKLIKKTSFYLLFAMILICLISAI